MRVRLSDQGASCALIEAPGAQDQAYETGAARLRRHGNRREIHEPALRLYKALDLRAHGAWRDVMGNIKERGVVPPKPRAVPPMPCPAPRDRRSGAPSRPVRR